MASWWSFMEESLGIFAIIVTYFTTWLRCFIYSNINLPIPDLHEVSLPLCTSELKGKGGINMQCS
jgi:hypothetical protein